MPPISLCVCMCMLLGNGWVKKHYSGNLYTSNNRRIVGRVVFYAAYVVSMESLLVCVPPVVARQRLGINKFQRQGGIVEGVVFYAVHVVSKGNRLLVLPRILFTF
jgi:hypothetical protein